MEKKRVYISGPMAGIVFDNREEFIRANKWITEQNQEPINPFKLALEQDRTRAFSHLPSANYAQRLALDIKAMAEYAEAVCVLPGWESSKGASLEVAFAVNVMGIPVYEAYTNKPVSLDVIVTNEESEAIQSMEQLLNECKIPVIDYSVNIMNCKAEQLPRMISRFLCELTNQRKKLIQLKKYDESSEIFGCFNSIDHLHSIAISQGNLSAIDRNSIRSNLKHAYKIYSLAIDPSESYGTESSQAVASERS